MRNSSKVVVITGASAGVGRATAQAFAREGVAIALLARGRQGLEAALEEVEAKGAQGLTIPCDVADAEQVNRAAATIEDTLGPIDIWINNAMATVYAPVAEMSPDEFRRANDVTYLGAVWGTMAALRYMRPRNHGTIVQVSSALSYRPIPLQAAYCGAKHALRAFTISLRSELLHERSAIRLSMVHLPAVNTPQFGWSRSHMPLRSKPVPPIFQPEVAAKAIHWAAHHPRRDLYVGMSSVKAFWGNLIAPGLVDRYLARAGYDMQQSDVPADPSRPDNLWAPVNGDRGAHGEFDREAHSHSAQLWMAQHRGLLTAGVLGSAALGGWLLRRRKDKR